MMKDWADYCCVDEVDVSFVFPRDTIDCEIEVDRNENENERY
jgi:hypothetical protein